MSVTAESGGSLIAFGQSGEEFRSVDDGVNWSAVDTGTKGIALFTTLEQNHTILAAGDEGTILRSVDSGASWSQQYRERNFTVVDLFRGSPGTVLAIGNYSVHTNFFGLMARSTDGGITWSKVKDFGTKGRLVGVVYLPDGTVPNK
jgi:photosystem II stability/assembly factor-like uncharacterized protein